MQHKYVRFENLGFILWPYSDDLFHSHVGRTARSHLEGDKIISAGFAEFRDGKVKCHGKSESLSIGSRSDDGVCLAAQLGLKG